MSTSSSRIETGFELRGPLIGRAAEGCSLVVVCMDRNQHLAASLESWLAVEGVDEISVLDWSSEVPVAETLRKVVDPRVVVTRVEGERWWHLARALNVALRLVKYRRVLKVDADVSVDPQLLAAHPLEAGTFYAGNWRLAEDENERHLNGSFYGWREEVLALGGYDERIASYGWDDSDLYSRWALSGSQRLDLKHSLLKHQDHGGRTARQPIFLRDLPVREDAVEPLLIERNRLLCEALEPWGGTEAMAPFRVISKPSEGMRLTALPAPSPTDLSAEVIEEATIEALRSALRSRGLPRKTVDTAALDELSTVYALLCRIEPVVDEEPDNLTVLTVLREDELSSQRVGYLEHLIGILTHQRPDAVHVFIPESDQAGVPSLALEAARRCPVTLAYCAQLPSIRDAVRYANAQLPQGTRCAVLPPGAKAGLNAALGEQQDPPGTLLVGEGAGSIWASFRVPYLGAVEPNPALSPWVEDCGTPVTEPCPRAPTGGPTEPGSPVAWGCNTHESPEPPQDDGLGGLRRELEALQAENLRLERWLEHSKKGPEVPDLGGDWLGGLRLIGRAGRHTLHRLRMVVGLEPGPRIPIKPPLRDGLTMLRRAAGRAVRPATSEIKASDFSVRPLHRLPLRAQETVWMPADRRLVLGLRGRLAERLEVLEAGLEVQQTVGCRLEVHWPVDSQCPWKLHEVFDRSEGLEIEEVRLTAALRTAGGETSITSAQEFLGSDAAVVVWRSGSGDWEGPAPDGRLGDLLLPGFGPDTWPRRARELACVSPVEVCVVLGESGPSQVLMDALCEIDGVVPSESGGSTRVWRVDGQVDVDTLGTAIQGRRSLALWATEQDVLRSIITSLPRGGSGQESIANGPRYINPDVLADHLAQRDRERDPDRVAATRSGLGAYGVRVLEVGVEHLRCQPAAVMGDLARRLGRAAPSRLAPPAAPPPPLGSLITNEEELYEFFPERMREAERLRFALVYARKA